MEPGNKPCAEILAEAEGFGAPKFLQMLKMSIWEEGNILYPHGKACS